VSVFHRLALMIALDGP